MNDVVKPSGARIMLWDDGIENDPAIMRFIPRDAVIVNWYYGGDMDMYDYSADYLLWADPFDPRAVAHMNSVDVSRVRLEAEDVGRKFQAAKEIADYYADAQAHAHQARSPSGRDAYWVKYWFWELRDGYEELEPLYAAAWRYENRESHLASNVERYHLAAQRNIERADAVYDATLDYAAGKPLPPLSVILSPPRVILSPSKDAEPVEGRP